MKLKYPFRNLVFKGGGILGIAYLGALEVLDSEMFDILSDIKRISGASAGAITALAVSLNDNFSEIKQMADTLDFTKVPQKDNKKKGKSPEIDDTAMIQKYQEMFGTTRGKKDWKCVKRLLSVFGWYSSDYFYNWLRDQIQTKFDQKQPNAKWRNPERGLQTFGDFKNAGFRDLYISVTNVTKHTNEILSYETAPSMTVADAVRMSMSIPLFFEAVKYHNNYYADGGIVNNYPMEVFDNIKYINNNKYFRDGINHETLGCHLFEDTRFENRGIDVLGLLDYVNNLVQTILNAQEIKFNTTPNLRERSANISSCGISVIDFDVKKDDEKYNLLYKAGKAGMTEYLQNYTSNAFKNSLKIKPPFSIR